jgi:hypothetical protein
VLDVETAGFMLYDPERSELVLQQPAFGIDAPERIAAYHVALPGVHAAQTGDPAGANR